MIEEPISPYAKALLPERPERPRPQAPASVSDDATPTQALAARRHGVAFVRREVASPDPLRDRWEKFQHDHPETQASPAPNSYEEAEAVALMDNARAEEIAQERKRSRRGGRVALERIEGGRWVQYVSRGRGLGLDKVIA